MDEGSKKLATEELVETKISFTEAQSLTDEQKAQARENIGVEADWSENDPNASGYIKNRTHWVEPGGKVLFNDTIAIENGEVFEEEKTLGLQEDCLYTVILDGVEYQTKSYMFTEEGGSAICIGNPSFLGDFSPTEEPFVIVEILTEGVWGVVYPDAAIEYSLTIIENFETIHKIDSKFLSDDVPHIEYNLTDTITFDGNMDGKLSVDMGDGAHFVKVSNGYVDSAAMIGGKISPFSNFPGFETETITILEDFIRDASLIGLNGYCIIDSSDVPWIAVLQKDSVYQQTPVEKGIYFMCQPGQEYVAYAAELKLLTKTIKTEVYYKIDTKLLPGDFALKDDLLELEQSVAATEELVAQKSQVQIITWEADD
jgi:hypothetical protein